MNRELVRQLGCPGVLTCHAAHCLTS